MRCTTKLLGEDKVLQRLFSDRMEYFDGNYNTEFYFYALPEEVADLVVGFTNILRSNGGCQNNLFINSIETRYNKDRAYDLDQDKKLFQGEHPLAIWSEQLELHRGYAVLVSGEILLPDNECVSALKFR